MGREHLWQKPTLRQDEEENKHRAVTWLELFFDLVFVVVFEKLAHDLATHFNMEGLGFFVLLFFAVFWVWNASVYYVERFESEGIEIRFFTFFTMVAVTGLAIYAHDGLDKNYTYFVGAYLLARVINMTMWMRSGVHVPEFLPIAKRFFYGFLLTLALLVGSLLVDKTLRISLFALAIIIDIITPYFTMKLQAKLPRISSSKFPERFGLLTIIILGAMIVEIIKELSNVKVLTAPIVINGLLALYVVFSIWSIYFDFIARRAPKEKITTALFWVYIHLGLLATIVVMGIPLADIIDVATGHGGGHGEFADYRALPFAVGLTLIGIAVLETTLKEHESMHPVASPSIKAVTGFSMIGISFVAPHEGVWVLTISAVAVTIPKIYGAKILFWNRKE